MSKGNTTIVSRNEVQRVLDLSTRGEVIFEFLGSGGVKIYDGTPDGYALEIPCRADAQGFPEAHAAHIASGRNPQAIVDAVATPATPVEAPAEDEPKAKAKAKA